MLHQNKSDQTQTMIFLSFQVVEINLHKQCPTHQKLLNLRVYCFQYTVDVKIVVIDSDVIERIINTGKIDSNFITLFERAI